MPQTTLFVTVRPATAADDVFLLQLFAGSRPELSLLNIDDRQKQDLIEMQFRAQRQQYLASYPQAEHSIILLAEEPVGRTLVERSSEANRLVDIAILAGYQNRGIGSFLLRGLIAEAAASHKPLELSVYKFNPAARLYQRLGFLPVGEEAGYIQMQLRAE